MVVIFYDLRQTCASGQTFSLAPEATKKKFPKLSRSQQIREGVCYEPFDIAGNRFNIIDQSFTLGCQSLTMGRPKRNVFAAAEETSTPPRSLTATQTIARVIKAEGNALYSCTLPDQKTVLVELPSRFRNTIWIKRGGYLLIDTKEAGVRQNKIDGEIINVVRDEHLWRKKSYW